MRRVLAILLALTMMLSLTVSAAWADDPDPTPGTPVGTEEPANSDPAPANSGGGEETPTTPGNETPATPGGETPAAPAGKIMIIYTNDVHTYIDNDTVKDKDGNLTQPNALTYAHVAALKEDKIKEGNDVLLVDAGDHIQGTAYGGMDQAPPL